MIDRQAEREHCRIARRGAESLLQLTNEAQVDVPLKDDEPVELDDPDLGRKDMKRVVKQRIAEIAVMAGVFCLPCAAQSPLDQILQRAKTVRGATGSRALSNEKIVAGLKEALTVSTRNAVTSTGRPNGFLENAAIKILLPPKLSKIGTGMRLVGMGAQVDALARAAGRPAAGSALPFGCATSGREPRFEDGSRPVSSLAVSFPGTEGVLVADGVERVASLAPIGDGGHVERGATGEPERETENPAPLFVHREMGRFSISNLCRLNNCLDQFASPRRRTSTWTITSWVRL